MPLFHFLFRFWSISAGGDLLPFGHGGGTAKGACYTLLFFREPWSWFGVFWPLSGPETQGPEIDRNLDKKSKSGMIKWCTWKMQKKTMTKGVSHVGHGFCIFVWNSFCDLLRQPMKKSERNRQVTCALKFSNFRHDRGTPPLVMVFFVRGGYLDFAPFWPLCSSTFR